MLATTGDTDAKPESRGGSGLAFEIQSFCASHSEFRQGLETAADLSAYIADLSTELRSVRAAWVIFERCEIAYVSDFAQYNQLIERLEAFRTDAVERLKRMAGPNVVAPDFVSRRAESL